MKKWLVLALTCLLVLGLTTVSWANTLYLDLWNNGELEDADNRRQTGSTDLSQISIGLEIPTDQFKFSGLLSTGTIEAVSGDFDTTSFLVKGGIALINDPKLRLDATAGFFNRGIKLDLIARETGDIQDKQSFYSLTVGFDTQLILEKNAWIDFSYSFGIDPTVKNTYLTTPNEEWGLDSITVWNLKFNYLFSDLGASVGYYSEQIENLNATKLTFSGLTVGLFYKF